MDQRARFVVDVERGEFSMVQLCASYGISRKTGYKWLKRFKEAGVSGLADRSRARRDQPGRVPDAVRELIVEARRAHPSWGPKKLRPWLARQHPTLSLPSLSSFHSILKEAKLIHPQRRRRHPVPGGPGSLGGEDCPNGVWCVDFKGEFKLRNGSYCYPLTVSEGLSRMLLACRGQRGVHAAPVKRVFINLFETHGVPAAIRSDNGSPFASSGIARLSRLSVWWLDQGIALQRIAPGRPQQNGRHERIHRTLKQETTRPPGGSMRAQQRRFDAFRQEYNWQRPHEALDDRCPGELFVPATRAYHPAGVAYEYPAHYEVRRVFHGGDLSWHCQRPFVGHALAGREVGLVEIDEGCWRLHYREHAIGLLDERDRQTVIRPIPPTGRAAVD